MGLLGADVMLRLNRLQEDQRAGSIQIFFDAEKMGHQSYSLAMQVPAEYEDQAFYHIAGHPGVMQCIKRKGSFNFWFSMMLPAEESLEFHLGRLQELSQAQKFLILKTEKIYKPLRKKAAVRKQGTQGFESLTMLERKLIAVVQEEFPLADAPYGKIAEALGTSEAWVLKQLHFFQKKGLLRKIAVMPALRVKKEAGTLLLWNVSEEKIEQAAAVISGFPEIGFCAKRVSCEALPYNLHVLAEGIAEEKVPALTDKMERGIGMWPRQTLLRVKEEKRAKFNFFSNEVEMWRLQNEEQPAAFFTA